MLHHHCEADCVWVIIARLILHKANLSERLYDFIHLKIFLPLDRDDHSFSHFTLYMVTIYYEGIPFYHSYSQKQQIKCVLDLFNDMPARLKKSFFFAAKHNYAIQRFPTGLACECTDHSHGCDGQLLACHAFPFTRYSPFSSTENHNSIKVDGQSPSHTYGKISTYFWHTSCLQLIQTCFIYETRQREALLFSKRWKIKAANVSTHTSTRN